MIETLPLLDDPASVRSGAAALLAKMAAIHTRSTTIRTGWQGLAHSYKAPEAPTVLTAMDQPQSSAATLERQGGKVKAALDTYADTLVTLHAERLDLMGRAKQWNTDMATFRQDTDNPAEALKNNFLGGAERDLMDRGQDIQSDMDAWQARCDEAQRVCANAIRAVFGALALKAADRATVEEREAGTVFGYSEDGYHGQTLAGKTPWFDGVAWNGVGFAGKTYSLGQGAVGSVTEVVDFGAMIIGRGEEGEREAFMSGMKQIGGALATSFAYSQVIATPDGMSLMTEQDRAEYDKVNEILVGVGKAAVSSDTWGSTGWRTAGGFAPDAIMAIATGGTAAAGKASVRAGVKGALGSAIRAGRVLAPGTATRISRLASALDAATLPGGSLNRGLTAVRNTAMRVESAHARVQAIKASMPAAPLQAAAAATRRVQNARQSLGAHRPPALALAGVPRGAAHADRLGGAAYRVTQSAGPVGRGTSTGVRASEADTSRFLDKALPPVPKNVVTRTGAGRPSFTGSNMLVRPRVEPESVVKVDIAGDSKALYPKAREAFGSQGDLAPNTAYEVRGRGTFFTNADGKVDFVVTERRSFSLTSGAQLSREFMSSDLRTPLPDTTYVIDGTYFHTNAAGQTDHVYVPDLTSQPDNLRSVTAQRNVAGGVDGYDAGHLQSRETGGAREEINLVQMVSELNRGSGGRSLATNDSWRHLELLLNDAIAEGKGVSLSIQVRYSGSGVRPTSFLVGVDDAAGNSLFQGRIRNA